MKNASRLIVALTMAIAAPLMILPIQGWAIVSSTPAPVAQVAQTGQYGSATQFVEALGGSVLSAIKDGTLTGSQGEAWFAQFIDTNFDVPTIGRFVLGRYWRAATPEQQQEYQKLFRDMIIKVYAKRFRDYSGETFKTTSEQEAGTRDRIVNTVIQPSGKPAISTQWRVRPQGAGNYKVIDLVIENISMAITQKAEFASIIEQHGGDVNALIDTLKTRIADAG